MNNITSSENNQEPLSRRNVFFFEDQLFLNSENIGQILKMLHVLQRQPNWEIRHGALLVSLSHLR
jgi:hypothetical protein